MTFLNILKYNPFSRKKEKSLSLKNSDSLNSSKSEYFLKIEEIVFICHVTMTMTNNVLEIRNSSCKIPFIFLCYIKLANVVSPLVARHAYFLQKIRERWRLFGFQLSLQGCSFSSKMDTLTTLSRMDTFESSGFTSRLKVMKQWR